MCAPGGAEGRRLPRCRFANPDVWQSLLLFPPVLLPPVLSVASVMSASPQGVGGVFISSTSGQGISTHCIPLNTIGLSPQRIRTSYVPSPVGSIAHSLRRKPPGVTSPLQDSTACIFICMLKSLSPVMPCFATTILPNKSLVKNLFASMVHPFSRVHTPGQCTMLPETMFLNLTFRPNSCDCPTTCSTHSRRVLMDVISPL